jgi:cellulose binding protein with CBM2 domain/Big-like domain-containing protein
MNVLPFQWRRAGRIALTAAAVAAAVLVPSTPSQAQADCLAVDYQATSWSTGAATGGFVAQITITNTCAAPVVGWTLALTLPPGHAFQQGWSAGWVSSGATLTATDLPWNRVLDPGEAITIGFVGSWSGTYQDPLGCSINGRSCGGDPGANEPPAVTLTRPNSSFVGVVTPCPFVLAADAGDPDGAIDRVEFYVNSVLVGTDRTAPYLVGIPLGGLPPPRSSSDWVAVARAYDDGVPQLSTDSPPVTFRVAIGDPLPETIFACSGSLTLAAGSSEPVRFALFSSIVNQVTLTVTGDPRITVSPTTVVRSGNLIQATVTAAPGSAGASATITAVGGELRPATMLVTVS